MSTLFNENQLINLAIDSTDTAFFARNGITREWFPNLPEAFDLFERHVREFGEIPSVSVFEHHEVTRGGRSVTLKEAGFDGEVSIDKVHVVRAKLGEKLAWIKYSEWLEKGDHSAHSFTEFGELQAKKHREFQQKFGMVETSGEDLLRSGHLVESEYDARKDGKVGVKIPTPYAALNDALGGGMETGDLVVLMAFTNKGKTWEAIHFGETASYHGFKVVHAALEMSKARLRFRWHAMRSYRLRGRGFSNREMLAGHVSEEAAFREYLRKFDGNSAGETPGYILKVRGEYPNGLTLAQIERDIVENDLSGGLYILDQLNLAEYHALPGGMKEFNRKLTGIFAKYGVVGLVMTQANGDSEKKKQKDEDGRSILQPPDLGAYSETIATIQDARTVLTFDSLDSNAILSLEKATDGGVGTQIPLFWNPDQGEICELTDEITRQLEAAKSIDLM